MKIAFSGSGGTGKTTLLKELNKTMYYPVINEGIREWLRLHKFNDFKEMNEVFQEFFPVEPPARTTSIVKAFPPGVLIEIDAIALKP